MKLSKITLFGRLSKETTLRPLPKAPTAEDLFVAEMRRRADDHPFSQVDPARRYRG